MRLSFTLLKNCPVFNLRSTTRENCGAAVNCCGGKDTTTADNNLTHKNDAMLDAASFSFIPPQTFYAI